MEEKLLEELRDAGKLFSFLKEEATAEDADAILRKILEEPVASMESWGDEQRFFNFIGWAARTPIVLPERAFDEEWRRRGKPQIIYHGDRREGKTDARLFALQYMGRLRRKDGTLCRQYMGTLSAGTYFGPNANIAHGWWDWDKDCYHPRHVMIKGFFNNERVRIIERERAEEECRIFHYNTSPGASRFMAYSFTSVCPCARYAALAGYNVMVKYWPDQPGNVLEWVVLDRSVTTICDKIAVCEKMSVNANGVVEDW